MPRSSHSSHHFVSRWALNTASNIQSLVDQSLVDPSASDDLQVSDLDPFDGLLLVTEAEALQRIARPHRKTLLHILARWMFCTEMVDGTEEFLDPEENSALLAELIDDYKLQGEPDESKFEKLVHAAAPLVARDVFQILFMDREFLRCFGTRLSMVVGKLRKATYPRSLKRDGVVKRARVPTWLERGVFFRDQGRCVMCRKDLTGLFHTEQVLHLDHIVPLGLSGTNDPTNYQLLCGDCNADKRDHDTRTSGMIISFWEYQ